MERSFLFTAKDTVAGKVNVNLKGKKLDHLGMKIELIGQVGRFGL
jgi:hypothetical protein